MNIKALDCRAAARLAMTAVGVDYHVPRGLTITAVEEVRNDKNIVFARRLRRSNPGKQQQRHWIAAPLRGSQ